MGGGGWVGGMCCGVALGCSRALRWASGCGWHSGILTVDPLTR